MKNSICYVSLIFTLTTSIVLGDENPKSPFSDKESSLVNISKIFTKLDSIIPKLTPAEEKWVIQERLAYTNGQSEGARLTSFMQSREYSIYALRRTITEVTNMVQAIKSAQIKANSANETLFWAFLVQALQGDIKRELELLAAKGIVTKTDLNIEMGFNWLTGTSSGEVQLLWGYWAREMWKSFVAIDLVMQLQPE